MLELLPPATDADLSLLRSEFDMELPAELVEALRVSSGFANGPLESLGFMDVDGFGMEDLFPHPFPLAHDGFGNYWILDLRSGDDGCGPVFYACHDPPVIAFQSNSASDFVREALALWQPGPRSPVDLVHEDVTSAIWASNSGLADRDTAMAQDDPVLGAFAADFPPEAVFADLRDPRLGDGFSWGRYGPRTDWSRAGSDRIWAAVPPPPKEGLLARVFRRGRGG